MVIGRNSLDYKHYYKSSDYSRHIRSTGVLLGVTGQTTPPREPASSLRACSIEG